MLMLLKKIMKNRLLLLFIPLNLFCQQLLTEQINFGSNPGNLKLFYYNKQISIQQKPLVVVLHGCGQTAKQIDVITLWSNVAEQNNFTVIYPQQKITNNPNLCFNWFKDSNQNLNDETKSIYEMIRFAIDSLNIDTTKIFVYGVSAGANVTQILCANLPWLINSAAILAGTPYKVATGFNAIKLIGKTIIKTDDEWGSLVRLQNPEYKGKYPTIILMHGTNDFIANYAYCNQSIKQWLNVHNVKNEPLFIKNYLETTQPVIKYFFGNDSIHNALIFYKIENFGHKIPVDNDYKGKNSLSKNINFNSTKEIANDFKLIYDGK